MIIQRCSPVAILFAHLSSGTTYSSSGVLKEARGAGHVLPVVASCSPATVLALPFLFETSATPSCPLFATLGDPAASRGSLPAIQVCHNPPSHLFLWRASDPAHTDAPRSGVGSDEYDQFDLELMYPPSPATNADAGLPPADELGEPEVDPESRSPSPAAVDTVAGERSSHSRKKKPGHIPRPPNAFMIFRSDLWNKEKIKSTVERDHRQISRIAGSLWNSLGDAERAPYHQLADEAKKEHARKYPQYKYSPIYRKDKPAKRKPKQDHVQKVLRCETVARLIQRGFEGDDLKKELDRREAGEGSDDLSDSSEYVSARPRKAAARPRAQASSSRARPRRERRVRIKDDDDYVPEEHNHTPTFMKEEKEEAYIPTSEIPTLDLGMPCSDDEVRLPP